MLRRFNFSPTAQIPTKFCKVSATNYRFQREVVRGGGTSDFWVSVPRTRKRIFWLFIMCFSFFQFFAPKRMDYMKKRFDNELQYYEDMDKKKGMQKQYAVGSDGKASVLTPKELTTARPPDASGAVTEPDFATDTGKMFRPSTLFGWYSKD